MNAKIAFERRVVLAASLFLGDNLPIFIIADFASGLSAEDRADTKAYMATMVSKYEMIAPILVTEDFAPVLGESYIDAVNMANELNEKYAARGVRIELDNIVEFVEARPEVLLQAYRDAADIL